jgi:predicted enzyme related to lactoylglutathione lyase
MQRVTGIGGVFLRGHNPEALRAWYDANLGIPIAEWGGHVFAAEDDDSTVWSIFQGDTEYWPRQQQVMVNYRVPDLDAMLDQLRAAGAEVDDKVEELEFGRFGWAVDPEGNRFELWKPTQVVDSSG